jgi:hypothetical protein
MRGCVAGLPKCDLVGAENPVTGADLGVQQTTVARTTVGMSMIGLMTFRLTYLARWARLAHHDTALPAP